MLAQCFTAQHGALRRLSDTGDSSLTRYPKRAEQVCAVLGGSVLANAAAEIGRDKAVLVTTRPITYAAKNCFGKPHEQARRAMKSCKKCRCEKPLDLFYRHSLTRDGHMSECIACVKARTAAWHSLHAEEAKVRHRARAKLPNVIAQQRVRSIKWHSDNPLRSAAQQILRKARRRGDVIPWPVCAMPECECKPEAHHPDYSRPLDVVWLCSSHHKLAHGIFTRAK